MATTLYAASLVAGTSDGWEHDGWWPVWPLLWLVVLGIVIWLAVRAFRSRSGGGDRALEILAVRYARGELSTEEYKERLEQLR